MDDRIAPYLRRVMLIDDNAVDQMLYRRILERSGYVRTVLSFLYAEDALDHLEGRGLRGIDLILLDINMPRMNGFEFLNEVDRRWGEEFPCVVMMLTTSLEQKDEARARSYSMVKGYLHKPLTEDQVLDLASVPNGR